MHLPHKWPIRRLSLLVAILLASTLLVACGGGSGGGASGGGGGETQPDQGDGGQTQPGTGGETGTAALTWMPPTETIDGTSLDNLAGYRIYYGTASRQYSEEIKVDNPGIASYTVDGLSPGTYHFAVTAYTDSGIESPFSNEAVKTVEE